MDWLQQLFTWSLVLSWWQQLGLAFLLGSFSVATLSDLKYLAAQREFLEVWLLFIVAVFVAEGYDVVGDKPALTRFALKWALIALLSILSLERVGVLFRLAVGDVAALAAAASLLPPTLVLLIYVLAKCISWLVDRLFPSRKAYRAFMPVVSLATLAVLALGLLS